MNIIRIPRLNDGPADIRRMFEVWKSATAASGRVVFDFAGCDFLRPNAVAFLGGLIRLLELRGTYVVLGEMNQSLRGNLLRNGFLGAFGSESFGHRGATVPYREDRGCDPEGFLEYLAEEWLGKGWVGVSPALRDAISAQVSECYLNAFQHADSPVGTFTCGQYFPRLEELQLSIIDFGIGIPARVRGFLSEPDKPAGECLEWAFLPGHSTAADGRSRGLGLGLLRDFLKVNRGSLDIYSHDGYSSSEHGSFAFRASPGLFKGTLINIRIRCDSRFYKFSSENVENVPF